MLDLTVGGWIKFNLGIKIPNKTEPTMKIEVEALSDYKLQTTAFYEKNYFPMVGEYLIKTRLL
jgi:hypothetical protein